MPDLSTTRFPVPIDAALRDAGFGSRGGGT